MLARFTHPVTNRGYRGGQEIRIPKLFYRFDAKDDCAGHWRLFPREMGKFTGIRHHWNRANTDWAMTRVWNILGLVTIIHIDAGPNGTLKHTKPPGWHFRFAKITVGCVAHRTYGIMFTAADASYGA